MSARRALPCSAPSPLTPFALTLHAGFSGPTAVVNRDLDGALVSGPNYTINAAACADLCRNTTPANIWVWCGHTAGCTTGQGSYQQDLAK